MWPPALPPPISLKNIISRPEYVGKLLILFFSPRKRDSIELFRLVFKWRKETGVTASVIPTQVTGQPVLPLPRGDDLRGDDRQTHIRACRASRSGGLVEGKERHGDERRSGTSLALGEAAAAREDACLD